ncbi:arylamine N-acetyltransferase [Fluoribacter gormanii]|uniref:arylamine N-acetyltransferase family protein n=1 Tax=Fluoribacter gormanii TaxID=464 RepID=UPI001041AA41|nr:arylamine N-acetyltransferase [Fluoribacter gormanii]MCW8469771.1 arylamine N-acetyltransferase [Fluoribacter gormanii]
MKLLTEQQMTLYFARIGHTGSTNVTLENLESLHESHIFNIPFEGISVHLNPPEIELDAIYNKLIKQKRGGYCYEMNGLFYIVLKTLGFEANLYLAEVVYDTDTYRQREPRHAFIIVNIDDKRYLVDVGYGRNGLIRPLSIDHHDQQSVYHHDYRILYTPEFGYQYQYKIGNVFKTEYRFDYPADGLTLDQLKPANEWVSTSKDSSFVKNVIVMQMTREGKITFVNNTKTSFSKGVIEREEIKSLAMYDRQLREVFGISLNSLSLIKLKNKLDLKTLNSKNKTGDINQSSFFIPGNNTSVNVGEINNYGELTGKINQKNF